MQGFVGGDLVERGGKSGKKLIVQVWSRSFIGIIDDIPHLDA
jgi:hypothetical protein